MKAALGTRGKDYIKLFDKLEEQSKQGQTGAEGPTVPGRGWGVVALREAVTMGSLMYPGGGGGFKRGGTSHLAQPGRPDRAVAAHQRLRIDERRRGRRYSNDEFCIKNDEFSIQNDAFCIKMMNYVDFASLWDPDCLAPYTNLFVLGMPASHKARAGSKAATKKKNEAAPMLRYGKQPFIDRFEEDLAALGAFLLALLIVGVHDCAKNDELDRCWSVGILSASSP